MCRHFSARKVNEISQRTASSRSRKWGSVVSGRKVAGWREWCALPDLGVARMKAKLDTGARTSALHAFGIEPVPGAAGTDWVKFRLHPEQRSTRVTIDCRARILDLRWVRNPGFRRERRYVVATTVALGDARWEIELALTARDEMGFRLLLGRTALKRRILIDPARSFCLGGALTSVGGADPPIVTRKSRS
jgi:hypothetical protein